MVFRLFIKYMHIIGICWFIFCLLYTLALVLHQAGFNWWIIFSLSGNAIVIITILVLLYSYVIYESVSEGQSQAIEHQLTVTKPYMILYLSAPFLGSLAGLVSFIGVEVQLSQLLLGTALATMVGTFLIWIIVDPAVSFLETVLVPESRRHKAERLARTKLEKQQRQKAREQFLNEVLNKEKAAQLHWQKVLEDDVQKVVQLLTDHNGDSKQVESQIVKIGVKAWQTGGINCMKTLRDMTMQEYKRQNGTEMTNDYISCWWDGVGNWRTI
jgi:hypothetical protein